MPPVTPGSVERSAQHAVNEDRQELSVLKNTQDPWGLNVSAKPAPTSYAITLSAAKFTSVGVTGGADAGQPWVPRGFSWWLKFLCSGLSSRVGFCSSFLDSIAPVGC